MHRHRPERTDPAVAQGSALGSRRRGCAARRGLRGNAAVRVPIERVDGAEDLPLPHYASSGAAGADLCAAVRGVLRIEPGARVLVPTGLRIALPEGYEAQVRPRSGLALRYGVMLPNAPGTIDADYRGEIQVILWNAGHVPFEVRRGDRIAQLVVAPIARVEWDEQAVLGDTERGAGGFGHTGRRARRAEAEP